MEASSLIKVKTMSIKTIVCIWFFALGFIGFSQTKKIKSYTLNECIAIAVKNNLELKSSVLSANTTKINFQQSKANLLPSLSGSYNIGVNSGRSINPFTNDFVNQELTFSNARLNLDVTIFNGFRLINSWKQERLIPKAVRFSNRLLVKKQNSRPMSC